MCRRSQLVPLQDIDSLRDLDIGQKRTLICRELERSLVRTRNTADTLLGKLCDAEVLSGLTHIFTASVEMVLLLLWRHITYYCESRHINNPTMKASTAAVLRSVPQPFDSDVFREEAAKRLSHALHQLNGLNFVSLSFLVATVGHNVPQDHKWRESQAYIEIMTRRIRESVGLRLENDEANGVNA